MGDCVARAKGAVHGRAATRAGLLVSGFRMLVAPRHAGRTASGHCRAGRDGTGAVA